MDGWIDRQTYEADKEYILYSIHEHVQNINSGKIQENFDHLSEIFFLFPNGTGLCK